jgi:polyketide synthase PksN
MDSAIIGIAFRFPGANDSGTFWTNLANRKSSVTEVPPGRWDWRPLWGNPKHEINKTLSRWGGFIDDVDAFDNEFFGLLPKVVHNMDPQQRIMLELAWSCLEDAGIAPSTLRGRSVGVYAGVTHHDYKELLASAKVAIEPYHYTGTATVVVPNRISHVFGLRGPSIPIDTACSSSLNAIHCAIQAFERGECEMALAGGISLILNPARHISVSMMGTLSPTGSCKTLDDRADGYVRGEGAGFFLLKPLDRALADGDRIHGVIKGSAINHCGKTHTLSYPSPEAQADVIVAAHESAGVPVSSVNFVELHGTGTAKGDPIEFEGLASAYGRLAERQGITLANGYCGLSSAKSNLGHLEAAAGMAGIVKVLLAFRHRMLPGFHDFRTLNRRVTIDGTPFSILDETRPWLPVDAETPLRAGVSSFGFGGTNAHLILEEPPPVASPKRRKAAKPSPYLIALSARTADALQRRRDDLLAWLQADAGEHALHEIARALLLDRDHLNHRFACVVEDLDALREALRAPASSATGAMPEPEAIEADRIEGESLLAQWGKRKKSDARATLQRLAGLFLGGCDLPWSVMFDDKPSRRVRLPTYPFARHRFWLPDTRVEGGQGEGVRPGDASPRLHPLLHRNAATVDARRFVSTFDGGERFLADHRVQGRRVLPGVAYLEMVRAAVDRLSAGDGRRREVRFSNVVWIRPLVVEDRPVSIELVLDASGADASSFDFCVSLSEAGAESQSLCRGKVSSVAVDDAIHDPSLDSATDSFAASFIESGASHDAAVATVHSADDIYAAFTALGLEYGPSHRVLQDVRVGRDMGLARIEVPESLRDPTAAYGLPPGMVDAALQAAVVFLAGSLGAMRASIPLSLDSAAVHRVPTGSVEARIRRADAADCFDLDLFDTPHDGHACLSIRGLRVHPLDASNGASVGVAAPVLQPRARLDTPPTLSDALYAPQWRAQAAMPVPGIIERLVLVGTAEALAPLEARLRASRRFADTRFERIHLAVGDRGDAVDDGAIVVDPARAETYRAAVDALAARGVGLDRVLLVPPAVAPDAIGDAITDAISMSAHHVFALIGAMLRGTKAARFVQLVPAAGEGVEYLGLSGLFKTLRIEKPSYSGRVVAGALAPAIDHRLADIVADEFLDESPGERDAVNVRYAQGLREVRGFAALPAQVDGCEDVAGFRDGGVYLITGGLGAIGRIVARHLCATYRARVYLTGRSEPSAEQRETMAALCADGGSVAYLVCDPVDRDQVRRAIASIHADGHRLNGVLHSAGMVHDNFILRKTPGEFAQVVAPKTVGTVHLDLETRDEPLDMFVLFASVAGAMGNVGQSDYAYGNAFEDAFAEARETLRARGERRGRALSVDWPFWRNGGMRLGEAEIAAIRRGFGMVPLEDADGLAALEFGLLQPHAQLVLMPGDAARVREVLGASAPPDRPAVAPAALASTAPAVDYDDVAAYLCALFAKALGISEDFEHDKSFKDYGFDSVVMVEIVWLLEKTFGSLTKTLFFEYPTLRTLTGYFLEHHAVTFAGILPSKAAAATPQAPATQDASAHAPMRAATFAARPEAVSAQADDPIVVIGIAGRYPQAESLDAFWENLQFGRDCIEEVPQSRPDLAAKMRLRPGDPSRGHSYANWGGFLRDVGSFDAMFFNISPREAEYLDPNERLFLEIAAHAIEDAGYTPDTLAPRRGHRGSPVGVYVGVMWGDYQLHGVDGPRDAWHSPHSCYWAIANRVSYQFNFSGPSMALDTACSSSMTAMHLACQAIRAGEIDVAIAGASNLSLHPSKYNLLSDMKFLSTDGRCRAFGEGGDGYVPGEGVGAVVLKSLSKARRDGDHIYGIIRGSAINHGGKASGFTVPNPNRQTELIRDALDIAGVDPRHISYVEAHGTGTSLGDPIEMTGLTKAFEQRDRQYCAIGSVKSNIGHLEAAAGVAALTKVLLQMRHRALVPSIHSDTLNPYIDFGNSPFRVQRTLQDWSRPVLEMEGVRTELPRIAGLSSFGAGGANAHMIIEEYAEIAPAAAKRDAGQAETPVRTAFVLSARQEPALRAMASRLADRLAVEPGLDLEDAAYTLQVGRVAMEFRVAFVVDDRETLLDALRAYAEHGAPGRGAWSGHRETARRNPEIAARLNADALRVEDWLRQGELASLAQHWANGGAVDWARLHATGTRRRIPLPGYVFQRQHYWGPETPMVESVSALHPMVDANVSTLDEQAFTKTFRAEEFFLRDHRLGDNRILPGVAYLELALQAARLAAPRHRVRALHDVQWLRPVVVDDAPQPVRVSLIPGRDTVAFDLYADGDEERKPYAHGALALEEIDAVPSQAPERLDLQAIRQRTRAIDRASVDAAFAAMGFAFGDSFRIFETLHCGADEALGALVRPHVAGVDADAFALHPAVLDAAIRTSLGVGGLVMDGGELQVPVGLRRIEIFAPIGERVWAHARRSAPVPGDNVPEQRHYDVTLCDGDGRVLIRIERLTVQPAPQLALAVRRAQARPAVPARSAAAPEAAVRSVAVSAAAPDASAGLAAQGEGALSVAATATLVGILSAVTKLPADQIDPDAPLTNYGIDSLMIATLNRELENRFGEVPKTLFFEYQELSGIAEYLVENHAEPLRALAPAAPAAAVSVAPATAAPAAAAPADMPVATPDTPSVLDGLFARMQAALGADADACRIDTPIAGWPLDPVNVATLIHALSQDFEGVDAFAPYRHATLADWASELRWLPGRAVQLPAVVGSMPTPTWPLSADASRPRPPAAARGFRRLGGAAGLDDVEDIAIIGLSGHYPGAEDLQGFWRNLAGGRDCISEIPLSRWDHSRIFDPDRSHKGTAYSKWGGFMAGVDHFDARFFSISAREAEIMDPQERLFLQTAWECVEDACYTRQSLKGQSVGVFVGVAWPYYGQFEVSDEQMKSGRPSTPFASIANRVSYVMNFNGPSMALDTMCSSSLTAIHLASRAIHNGDCDQAIAGGVNVIPHPNKYLQLSASQFLSSDGRCRAFGSDGDGYVPGEGVGAVMLKRLSRAIADGDHIYGVIKGTALNHGGKANGFTVPNQVAQTEVIGKALKRAGWDPRTIDYIEAHGTGTSLGDPIEIAGLSRAFAKAVHDVAGPGTALAPNSCRIGSVKSNVGHLESAAAIAGLTKILLQFRHGAIAPSLHASPANPNIDFARSPFRVVQQIEPWRKIDARTPRRAGLSSFGAGGSNAHCLIEDHARSVPSPAAGPVLFVLSADSEERLSRYVDRMIGFIERGGDPDVGLDLAALAYSSQVGRETMDERLAVVADSVDQLLATLRGYRDGNPGDRLVRGSSRRHGEKLEAIVDDAEKDALIHTLIAGGRLMQLARAWASMLDVDWHRHVDALYPAAAGASRPQRMPFPTMPFLTQRYWVDEKRVDAIAVDAPHPLIDQNLSTLSSQAYRKRFDGQEFYLRDHIVHTDRARKILPGVAYLEMARAAGDLAVGDGWRIDRIRHLMWMQPFEIAVAPDTLTVRMQSDDEALRFEIARGIDGVVCVEGELGFHDADALPADEWLDIGPILDRGTLMEPGCKEIYAGFERMGYHFGPSFMVTQARYRLAEGALCRLRLPEHLRAGFDQYGLHPAMLDAALRSGLAVDISGVGEPAVPIVPFSLGELEYRHPLTEDCYVYVVRSTDAISPTVAGRALPGTELAAYKFDIVVTDANGLVLVKLHEFSGRPLIRKPIASAHALQYFGDAWMPAPLPAAKSAAKSGDRPAHTVLIVADASEMAQAIQRALPSGDRIVAAVLAPAGDAIEHAEYPASLDPFDADSAMRLFASLHARDMLPDRIVYRDGASGEALSADACDAESLHRGIQAVRQLFIASERHNPGAPVRLLYAYRENGQPQPQHEAIIGYARSLLTVNHRFELSTFADDGTDPAALASALVAELDVVSGFGANEIALRGGLRYRRTLHPLAIPAIDASGDLPLREQGTYLITGGAGKLGLVVARWLATRCRAGLLLSGRSAEPSQSLRDAIDDLRQLGARVEYRSADIADPAGVEALVAEARREFGGLNGVIHCAGVASDRSILELDDRGFADVLSPKVDGLILLDRATAAQPLDFFVNFSSVSALIGDLGGGAYAVGNRFMDSHAQWRETLRAQGLRNGRSLSIGWPLWATGGMAIAGGDASVFGFSGLQALTEEEGLDAFAALLRARHDRVLVTVGDPQRIARTLRLQAQEHTSPAADAAVPRVVPLRATEAAPNVREIRPAAQSTPRATPQAPGDTSDLRALAERHVMQHMATVTKTTVDDIDTYATFEQCGMDSVLMLELHSALANDFEGLPKTALFEYDSAALMAGYLVARHGDALRQRFAMPPASANAPVAASAPSVPATVRKDAAPTIARLPLPLPTRAPSASPLFSKRMPVGRVDGAGPPMGHEDIAIIGMAGEFPDAPDLARFWQNMREGRDCLTRIPEGRGFASALNRHRSRSGVAISDKGGFIADIDLFDPQLFRMSHHEADKIDPQLRVLLRTAWRAVEDAAYTPETLAASRVGVFVGAMTEDFTRIVTELQMRSAEYLGPGAVSSELSNRLSFLMNFNGPSVTVSTACSSSLNALHLARRSILAGDCDVAMVGAANLSLHQSKYQLLHDMKVLSPDGQERTFDEAANGLVPSEGAGIVILKPLRRAIADGDNIHGVVRASRISHSGVGAGQFMPNLRVMQETAAECLREADIAAAEVTYLETHGTGTELGDPIELKALANALRRDDGTRGDCAIGSKANIGHMEAASGLGSLIKVLLGMRHGEIAPCAKLVRVNSSFDQADSPFYFPRQATSWPLNAKGTRIAGINSFGMGGSNAFVVVESHAAAVVEDAPGDEPVLFVLSARSADSLRAYAGDVAAFVRGRIDAGLSAGQFADLAHASQIGRIACRYRLAVAARSAADFIAAVEDHLRHPQRRRDDLFTGDVEAASAADMLRLVGGDSGAAFVDSLLQTRQIAKLAGLWVCGANIAWAELHRDRPRRRVSFPGMPFEQVSCGLGRLASVQAALESTGNASIGTASMGSASVDVPLLPPESGSGDIDVQPDPATLDAARFDADPRVNIGWCRLAASAIEIVDSPEPIAGDADDVGEGDAGDVLRRYWVDALGDAADTALELGRSVSLCAARALPVADGDPLPDEVHCVSELVDAELVRMLQDFGGRHGIAIETLITGAWAVLMNRYTKSRYSQFGLQGAMGVQDGGPVLLPVRIGTVGRQKILEWLSALQANLLRGHRLPVAPVERIGEWVGHDPLFDTVVVFDASGESGIAGGGDRRELASGAYALHARPRMELVGLVGDQSLELSLIYRAETPDHATAGVLLEQLKVLLEGLASNPDKMPSALGMRTRAESRERFWKTVEATTQ